MIDNADNYCKIITGDDTVNKTALNAMISVNIDRSIALELMAEPYLEVRNFRSVKPLLENCAVVKSIKTGRHWNVPHRILEKTEKV